MSSMSRITVTVPQELVLALDQKLTKGTESRSAVVRRLLEYALREAQEQDDIARYVKGYQEYPETDEEFGWLDYASE